MLNLAAVIYFLSLAALFLFLTVKSVENRRRISRLAIILPVVIVTLIVLALNVVTHLVDERMNLHIDMSQKKFYSISDETRTLLEGLDFFTPLKGMVTEPYNLAINHPYIDIAADENATVYSILDGTVVSAGYNEDTGYVMIIQHGNDLVSIYKHNDRLLKQAGDKVKTGTPIAIVGNTGRLATGVQLHLELWHAGEAIDPAKYISF